MSELSEIVLKFRHLKDLSKGALSIEQFTWMFEVLILWCIIKDEDEIEDVISRLQDEVADYMDSITGRKDSGNEVHGSKSDKIH